jgi:hypothetical protein
MQGILKTVLSALLLPVLAGFCVLPAAAAGPETFDIATFRAPPGWERVALPGLLSFRTPSARQGAAQIFLFPSQPSTGSPRANFEAEWARLVTAPLGPVPTPQLNTEQTPDGWTAVSGATNVTREGANMAVLLVTVTGFDRVMSVVVHFAGQEQVAEVDQFFRQLEFRARTPELPPAGATGSTAKRATEPGAAPASSPEKAEQVPIAPAGVENNRPIGLFYRLEVSMQGGARLEAKTRLFLPGNRIARTFPYGGGDAFDRTRCLPDTCGSYQRDGGILSVRWDNGQVDRWAFAANAEGITLDGTQFRPARPMTEAALVGEWTGAGDTGNPLSNVYRFERGGTFTFGTGQKPGAPGRYRVKGLTLMLTFADGSESRRTLFVAGKGEPIGLISVEGEVYKRK